jgi:hypothetical protein
MPRHPHLAQRSARITGSVYEKFRPLMAAQGNNLVALHIGDSYALPPYALPIDDAFLPCATRWRHGCATRTRSR